MVSPPGRLGTAEVHDPADAGPARRAGEPFRGRALPDAEPVA